jgi:hypothetical protein
VTIKKNYIHMKKLIFPALALLIFAACSNDDASDSATRIGTDLIKNPATAAGEADTVNIPVMSFEDDTWNFGLISQGEKVSYSYRFKNTGKTNLIISSAKGSCGCTVPEYPKKPIPPGGEGVIEVAFDSEGKSGNQSKNVTILANTYPATTILYVKGEIAAPGAN